MNRWSFQETSFREGIPEWDESE